MSGWGGDVLLNSVSTLGRRCRAKGWWRGRWCSRGRDERGCWVGRLLTVRYVMVRSLNGVEAAAMYDIDAEQRGWSTSLGIPLDAPA